MTIRIATRGSKLALWQTHHVRDILVNRGYTVEIAHVKTVGDLQTDQPLHLLGAQGIFTKALDDALLHEEADIAVHSAKDIPSRLPEGLELIALLVREDARDVLLAIREDVDLDNLSAEFSVGTSSIRRMAQLAHYTPHFKPMQVRGNVDTRVAKLEAGEYDALILAHAGVKRMGYGHLVRRKLNPATFTPAVGQGAIAVVARSGFLHNPEIRAALNHLETEQAVTAERAFLRKIEGGCHAAVFALATVVGDAVSIHGGVAAQDGSLILRDQVQGPADQAARLGESLADLIINLGGRKLLNG
jgi:hydroxymethylbilane synthase